MKYVALSAIVVGVGLVITGFSTLGSGAEGLDRLPLNVMMIVGGALLAIAGGGYFLVRVFMVL